MDIMLFIVFEAGPYLAVGIIAAIIEVLTTN